MTTIYLGEYTRVFLPYLDIGLITGNRGVQFHVFSFMQLYLLLRRSEMFMECDLRVHFSFAGAKCCYFAPAKNKEKRR